MRGWVGLNYIRRVGILYLAALILGGGTLAVQLFMGHDADAAGADASVDADFDADADMDVAGGPHLDAVHEADSDAAGFAAIFLSLRFWTFGFFAFGMVGTLLHYLHLSSSLVALLAALGMGLGSGFFASWIFQTLKRSAVSSAAEQGDAVGQVGKVLVPCERGGHAKVRLELRGQSVDFIATTDDEALADGELVLVEQVEDGMLHVSKAPPDFLSGRGEKS